MHRLVAVLATAAAVALAAGCGGGASADPQESGGVEASTQTGPTVTTVSSLTRQRFVARANSLCRRRWRLVLNAVRQTRVLWGREHPHVSTHQNFVRSVRLSYFASINFLIFDEIRRWGAPPGEARAVEKVTGAMEDVIVRGERHLPTTSVAQLKAMFAGYNRLASSYGLGECLVAGSHLPHPEA
jgi:hypothetical protein